MKYSSKDIGELNPLEIELIMLLRTQFRYGPVEIQMHDGLPRYLLKTVRRTNLGEDRVIHNMSNGDRPE